MNKTEAVRAVIAASHAEPIIFTTGYASRIAYGIADRSSHFYMTGSMGLASSIGAGVAQVTGTPTIVVDGDGALLMNPVGLVVAGAMAALPLVHVVLDDGRYASTGGQEVPSNATDLAAMAHACGYRDVRRITDAASLETLLESLLCTETGAAPVFVHCVLADPDQPVTARVSGDLSAHAERFARHVRELMLEVLEPL
jgi:thiamine pyrophosphate-dependent acetolactate synthase large subunit-like protein